MSKIQKIEINGVKAVVLPLTEYEALLECREDLEDIRSADEIKARIDAGEETFPAEVVERMIAGESAVRVFREYRGLTQKDLADAAGISVPAISKIERTGKASIKTMKAIATRMNLDLDDLV